MMSVKWHVTRLKYLVVLVFTAVLLLQTLRLALVKMVLPSAWADTDKYHLYRVLKDFQKFDVNAQPERRGAVWSKVQVNMSNFDNFLQRTENSYQEFNHNFKMLKSLAGVYRKTREQMALISIFRPSMTTTETAQLIFTLDTFSRACSEAGLVYFVLEASLMGVVRHHGLIPWDDDIDVVMRAGQWRQIRDVLANIEGFQLFAPPDCQWKFYLESATDFPDKPFKFPNLDIFFYDEDESHIWAVTRGLKHDLVYAKSDIFPLQLRPFEHLMVPVPCNLDLLVHKSHNKDVCVTPEYNHKTNENFYFRGTTSIHCHVLYDIYPFVFTAKSRRAGFQDEYLKVGTKVIHRITLPVGCGVQPLSATLP